MTPSPSRPSFAIGRTRLLLWILAALQIGLVAGYTVGVDYLHNHEAAVPGGEDCPAYLLSLLLSTALVVVLATAPAPAVVSPVIAPVPAPPSTTARHRAQSRAPPR